MGQKVNLGRVSFVMQGEWSSSKTYKRLDCVSSGGISYSAIQDVPAGTAVTNKMYWQILLDGNEIAESLSNKTNKTRIDFDGEIFKIDNRVLNYKELHDIHLEQPDFAFVVYGDRAYLLSYVQDDPAHMREMRFESVIAATDPNTNLSNAKVSGIYVRSSDGVKIAGVTVSDINSENQSNKATAITDANKGSTVWYPSTKAVADYVDGNVASLKSDIAKQSESIVEINGRVAELEEHPSSGGITEDVKVALLNCFKHVAWIDGKGNSLIIILEKAIEDSAVPDKVVTNIVVTYTGNPVVNTGRLTNTLAIECVAHYDDGTSRKVFGYGIEPEVISDGKNIITVTYRGLSKTFEVTGESIPVVLERIEATYNGEEVPIGTDVSTLDISVTAYYSDGSTQEVSDYTVSGTILEGTNTVTVSYNGKTTTVSVVGFKVIEHLFKNGTYEYPGFYRITITNNKHIKFENLRSSDISYMRLSIARLGVAFNADKIPLFNCNKDSAFKFVISNATYTGDVAPANWIIYMHDNSGDSIKNEALTNGFNGQDITLENKNPNESLKALGFDNVTNINFYPTKFPANSIVEFDAELYVDDVKID